MPTVQPNLMLPSSVGNDAPATRRGPRAVLGSDGPLPPLAVPGATDSIEPASTVANVHTPHQKLHGSLFLVGASLFTSGATLVGVSFLDSNPLLWSWGVPMALGGQGFFLIGLLLQLELLRKSGEGRATGKTPNRGQASSRIVTPTSVQPKRDRGRGEPVSHRDALPSDAMLRDLKSRLSVLGDRLSQSRG